MSLEDFIPDIESSEGEGKSVESSKEISEKFKEGVKKAGAKQKKAKKDEKKAKKYDILLAGFLVKIILEKKYDFILDSLFKTINEGYPSNFMLGILSLINTDISNKIREIGNKENIIFNFENKQNLEFDDSNLPPEIKDRINCWVNDIKDSVLIEYSHLQTKKIKFLLKNNYKPLINYTSLIFSFFLKEVNINVSNSNSKNICEFIVGEVENSIQNLKIEEI